MEPSQVHLRDTGREIHAGFIPLVDCAPLVMARELGFDRDEGFKLHLHREVSWANIRDKVDAGHFDCAHMLAPLPIAATLGIGRTAGPVIAPVALSLNGNTITVSNAVYTEMQSADAAASRAGGMAAARALCGVVKQRAQTGRQPLTLGMVFPFSCHNYDLRYWLAAAGIDPDNDVNLAVIPPPLIADSLRAGRVDGFCAGEPWGSVAADEQTGVIIATKNQLWRNSPEKVLGVRLAWAERNPDLLDALIRAVVRACAWLDSPGNRAAAAHTLSRPDYVGTPLSSIEHVLLGGLQSSAVTAMATDDTNAIVFHRHNATFPWQSHAIWIMTQMIRWGQIHEPFDLRQSAAQIFRTDLYRRALAGHLSDTMVPQEDLKTEGPEGFFDGARFDPADAAGYLKRTPGMAQALDLSNVSAKPR